MTERNQNEELQITPESLPVWRNKIASLREQPGKENETLNLIKKVKEKAKSFGEHEHVVNLYWEEYLVGKHMLMAVRDGSTSGPLEKAKFVAEGLFLMKNSSSQAASYIDKHSVESLRPRSHRFLGEMDMLTKQPKKAVEHFKTGIELFKQMEEPAQRVNALELSGFLAEALIFSGRINEGITIAQETFDAYDEGDGVTLKERDYYTWAVWKSGCATKVWNALNQKGVPVEAPTKVLLVQMLDQAESTLVFPDGKETWGDKNFSIRRTEIASIKRSIS
jgi:hypothetical protein